jgi:predicted Rdx family selenoprotein
LASSLAAAIEDRFSIVANLKEGHSGIFEVTISGRVIYSNRMQCGCLPENEEILQRICDYREEGGTQEEELLSRQDAT